MASSGYFASGVVWLAVVVVLVDGCCTGGVISLALVIVLVVLCGQWCCLANNGCTMSITCGVGVALSLAGENQLRIEQKVQMGPSHKW